MSVTSSPVRSALDWGSLAPLRLRARTIADGVYAGGHRSARRGAGVEFGGHRAYTPGDDLRWLDRRAMMRHGRLLIREFETETDRTLRLVLDATESMGFRSDGAPGAKLAYCAVLAAALARVALATGDPVALHWLGGDGAVPLPATGGREAFDRLVAMLESANAGGTLESDRQLDRMLAPVSKRARRGAVIVLFSDFLDMPEHALERAASLTTRDRTLVAVRVLDPVEARFPFEGPVLLEGTEGTRTVETDARAVRQGYLDNLAAIGKLWHDRLLPLRGAFVDTVTDEDPVQGVRSILRAAEGAR